MKELNINDIILLKNLLFSSFKNNKISSCFTIETFEEYIKVQMNYAKNELYQANSIYYDASMKLIKTYLSDTSFDVDLKVIEKVREIVALINPQAIDFELPF